MKLSLPLLASALAAVLAQPAAAEGVASLTAESFATAESDNDWKPLAVLYKSAGSTAVDAVFAELAEKSADMFKFAEVDTDAEKALAEAEGWNGETHVKVYVRPEAKEGKREGEWLEVDDDTDMKALYGMLTDVLPNYVTVIDTAPNLQKFVQSYKQTLPKVFLFSKKPEPTALYKAMSAE